MIRKKHNSISCKKKAFTLAEVLITILVLGIVLTLVMPGLVKNYKEHEIISAVKKFYSQFSTALSVAQVKNGEVESWNWDPDRGGAGAEEIMNTLAPYLKIRKRCPYNSTEKCFATKYYNLSNGNWGIASPDDSSNYSRATLADGMSIWIRTQGNGCSLNMSNGEGTDSKSKYLKEVCGLIGVDINGVKGPNILGKDTFYFWITKYGALPVGTEFEKTYNLADYCNLTSDKGNNGYACSAWIWQKGNVDYTKRAVAW